MFWSDEVNQVTFCTQMSSVEKHHQ